MTKLHFVKRARKTIRGTGVRKGMPYWWWKFSRQPKQVSLTKPPRSSLVRSPFLRRMAALYEEFLECRGPSPEDVPAALIGIAEKLRELGQECQEKMEAVLGSFPQGCPAMTLLHERSEDCFSLSDHLLDVAQEVEKICEAGGEDVNELVDGVLDQVEWYEGS